jgi:hypothetical protein
MCSEKLSDLYLILHFLHFRSWLVLLPPRRAHENVAAAADR